MSGGNTIIPPHSRRHRNVWRKHAHHNKDKANSPHARHMGQSYRTTPFRQSNRRKCYGGPSLLPFPRSQQGQGSLECKLPLALWPAVRVLGLLGLNLPPAVAAVADDSISATSAGVMKKRSSWTEYTWDERENTRVRQIHKTNATRAIFALDRMRQHAKRDASNPVIGFPHAATLR